jgi:hypothetical protein
MRIDAIDISHHNTIVDHNDIPPVPFGVWHKVNEGRAIDTKIRARLPWLDTLPMWGGYTVILPEAPGRSTIRQQIEQFVDIIGPYWRTGVGGQLDVERWGDRYGRPPSADEVTEAIHVFTGLLGRPPIVYMNRNEMPTEFHGWRATHPHHPYWMPGYSGPKSRALAEALDADVHQWSDTTRVPGFSSPVCVNEVLNPAALHTVCGITKEITEVQLDQRRLIDTRDEPFGSARNGATLLVNSGHPGAQAVVVNLVAITPKAPGFLTAYAGTDRPPVSHLNYSDVTIANTAIVPLNGDGTFNVYTLSECDILVDLQAVLS